MEKIIILDYGSQYTQLIARRIREFHVYSEIVSYKITAEEMRKINPTGIILSGGPCSVYAEDSPKVDKEIYELGVPILGICYGQQLTSFILGGKVIPGNKREFGRADIRVLKEDKLFLNIPKINSVWMSHGDKVAEIPADFETIADSDNTEYAAIRSLERKIWGVQFHPEVVHSVHGSTILRNFCFEICGCVGDWTMTHFIETKIEELRKQVGDGHVILGLSGGVDSSVAAALLHKAIGDQLTCIFVNNGVLRKDEARRVQELFAGAFKIKLVYVDATEKFLSALIDVTDPEKKRKIIGKVFVDVFDEESHNIPNVKFLAQGTLYPDVIESVSPNGNPSAMIKSHHNVGGLPDYMKLQLVEPFRELFKDEVREVGRQLGLPSEVVDRQPFPGPGLAVRILGEVTSEKVALLQEADRIVVDEMKAADLYYKTWQTFAVLLPVKSVGVMGDERTYENTCVVRAVESQDGMTADWVHLPYELLAKISNRIINEVRGINRVAYDISSKPPATIEWE